MGPTQSSFSSYFLDPAMFFCFVFFGAFNLHDVLFHVCTLLVNKSPLFQVLYILLEN